MATKKKAKAEPKKRRAPVMAATLTPEEHSAAASLALEHDTSVSRVIGAAVMALRASKSAVRHIEDAKARAPIGRPRTEE